MQIPFFKQINEHYCGPAILQMVLAAYGVETSQEALAEEIGKENIFERGTTPEELVAVLSKHRFKVDAKNLRDIAEVRDALEEGAIVVTCYTEAVWEWGHYALIRDISDTHVMFIDPDTEDGNVALPLREFEQRWKDPKFTNTVRWAAFIEPPQTLRANQ